MLSVVHIIFIRCSPLITLCNISWILSTKLNSQISKLRVQVLPTARTDYFRSWEFGHQISKSIYGMINMNSFGGRIFIASWRVKLCCFTNKLKGQKLSKTIRKRRKKNNETLWKFERRKLNSNRVVLNICKRADRGRSQIRGNEFSGTRN